MLTRNLLDDLIRRVVEHHQSFLREIGVNMEEAVEIPPIGVLENPVKALRR